jgi:SAM-dependent methyltransferase
MEDQQPVSDSAAYSAWKGWGVGESFGALSPGDGQYFLRELKEASARMGEIMRVHEVGFGDGQFLSFAKSQGWRVSGTELSPEQVAAGRAAGYDVFSDKDMASVPDSSLDLIVAFDVLEHIPQPDAVEFLSDLAAKLRPGGVMLFRYPNSDSWLGSVLQNGDPTHVTAIGYFKMKYFAERSSLDIVRYRAPVRRGFSTSLIHGIHLILASPFIKAIASLQKAIYFPGLPIVLSSHNVVCVLSKK